jgi:hypothetical protein
MEDAFRSSSRKNLETKGKAFAESDKGRGLARELDKLAASVQTHVKITDVPK